MALTTVGDAAVAAAAAAMHDDTAHRVVAMIRESAIKETLTTAVMDSVFMSRQQHENPPLIDVLDRWHARVGNYAALRAVMLRIGVEMHDSENIVGGSAACRCGTVFRRRPRVADTAAAAATEPPFDVGIARDSPLDTLHQHSTAVLMTLATVMITAPSTWPVTLIATPSTNVAAIAVLEHIERYLQQQQQQQQRCAYDVELQRQSVGWWSMMGYVGDVQLVLRSLEQPPPPPVLAIEAPPLPAVDVD